MGQCPGCSGWCTLVEERIAPAAGGRGEKGGAARGGAGAAGRVMPLRDVQAARVPRLKTGIGELDRRLGLAAERHRLLAEGETLAGGQHQRPGPDTTGAPALVGGGQISRPEA